MFEIFVEPLELVLEKKYYLNVIKQITVTDSYLALDKETRGCQKESFDDCTTRKYLNALMNKCQCLPFHILQTKKVGNMLHTKDQSISYDPQSPLCTVEHFDCVSRIKVANSDCLQHCSGILVTSYDQEDVENKIESKFTKLVEYISKDSPYLRSIKDKIQGSD